MRYKIDIHIYDMSLPLSPSLSFSLHLSIYTGAEQLKVPSGHGSGVWVHMYEI